jgi:hypothetical protein
MESFPDKELQEIESHGYKILEYSQPWRFVRGTAKKGDTTYFFKISPPDKELNERLQRQVSFDQSIATVIERSGKNPPFRVPRVYLSHSFDTSWVIYEYLKGGLLAEWTPTIKPKKLTSKIDQVVETVHFFDLLDTSYISLKNDLPSPEPSNTFLLSKIENWKDKPIEQHLLKASEYDMLYQIIGSSPLLPARLQHGDFVPWHMIEIGSNCFGLIDSEAASTHKPRFYDLAYFYHRVFTKLWQPDIAKQFLDRYLKRCNIDEDNFYNLFVPILAQRVVGGMFDYTNADHIHDKGKYEWSLHRRILELILKKDFNNLVR